MSVRQVDVRGPRLSAAVTVAVLGSALAVRGQVGLGLVGLQTAVFAIGTFGGVARSPYTMAFRALVRRGVFAPTTETEPAAGPRFAQGCGLLVASAATGLLLAGAATAGWVAVALVATLAGLQAFAGVCVGCEVHAQLVRRRAGLRTSRLPDIGANLGLRLRDAAGAQDGTKVAIVVVGTPTCSRCPATLARARRVAAGIGDTAQAGYVDAVGEPALTAALRVHRSPTVFVVAADGAILTRRSGTLDAEALAQMTDARF